jgi:hypothetical protein
VKEPKKFDCVEMKARIQQQLLDQQARLGDQEARRVQRETAKADPILGPFLARVRQTAPAATR